MGIVVLKLHHSQPWRYMKVIGQLHILASVPFGNKFGPYRIGGWVGHRTILGCLIKRKYLATTGIRTSSARDSMPFKYKYKGSKGPASTLLQLNYVEFD